jgi:hypothetical protein
MTVHGSNTVQAYVQYYCYRKLNEWHTIESSSMVSYRIKTHASMVKNACKMITQICKKNYREDDSQVYNFRR